MTSTNPLLSADGDEAADAIGRCEHGTVDGNTCEHCAEGAEDFGATPLSWCLMVLALTGVSAALEPARKGSTMRHKAPKEFGDEASQQLGRQPERDQLSM